MEAFHQNTAIERKFNELNFEHKTRRGSWEKVDYCINEELIAFITNYRKVVLSLNFDIS